MVNGARQSPASFRADSLCGQSADMMPPVPVILRGFPDPAPLPAPGYRPRCVRRWRRFGQPEGTRRGYRRDDGCHHRRRAFFVDDPPHYRAKAWRVNLSSSQAKVRNGRRGFVLTLALRAADMLARTIRSGACGADKSGRFDFRCWRRYRLAAGSCNDLESRGVFGRVSPGKMVRRSGPLGGVWWGVGPRPIWRPCCGDSHIGRCPPGLDI